MFGFLKNECFHRMPWKVKLPIIVAMGFILVSIPFILGILTPSIHEGNAYSSFYVLINIPAIFVLGRIAERLDRSLFNQQDNPNLVFITLALLFWVLASFIIAVFIDKAKNKKVNRV